MAAARVIVDFRDREHMEKTYYVGDMFEGSDERVEELIAGGYVEKIAEAAKKPTRQRKAAPNKER
jgi:hypothetical protein